VAETPKRLALIPARGGSKRLPGKNVRAFGGRPMIVWSIEHAFQSGLFDAIVVSSEDEGIGRTAEQAGAKWARRPSKLATDRVEVDAVCLDYLKREAEAGRDWDILSILYATAPLRAVDDIVQVVGAVEGGGADFAMTVTRYPYSPFGALEVDEEGNAHLLWPDLALRSRQDLPTVRTDVGSTYAARVQAYLEVGNLYGPNLKVVEVPAERGVDIDTADDVALAEFYLARMGAR